MGHDQETFFFFRGEELSLESVARFFIVGAIRMGVVAGALVGVPLPGTGQPCASSMTKMRSLMILNHRLSCSCKSPKFSVVSSIPAVLAASRRLTFSSCVFRP